MKQGETFIGKNRQRLHVLLKPWITSDVKELMAERDCALKVAKRSGAQNQWNNYRRQAEILYQQKAEISGDDALQKVNLIKCVSQRNVAVIKFRVIGSKKGGDSVFQVQDGKRLFVTISSKFAGRLCSVARSAWKKYELEKQIDIETPGVYKKLVIRLSGRDLAFTESKQGSRT